MAVAGFLGDELEITVQENTLLVAGKAKREDDDNRYLHHGIARRAFERCFSLADHIKVVGASLDNGMLHVDLVHEVPEAAKPRKVQIGIGQPAQVTPPREEPEHAKLPDRLNRHIETPPNLGGVLFYPDGGRTL
jgi:molecular chaperone IbpA